MNVEESDGESFSYKKAVKGEFNNSMYVFWQERMAYRSKLQDLISEDKKIVLSILNPSGLLNQ